MLNEQPKYQTVVFISAERVEDREIESECTFADQWKFSSSQQHSSPLNMAVFILQSSLFQFSNWALHFIWKLT